MTIETRPLDHPVSKARTKPSLLLVGVNPFEDVPGYQLLELLSNQNWNVIAADDSVHAIQILSLAGSHIVKLVHPSNGIHTHIDRLLSLARRFCVSRIIFGSDVHLRATAWYIHHTTNANASLLSLLSPEAAVLARLSLFDKPSDQDWLGQFALTPTRWALESEDNAHRQAESLEYPIMVKGRLKGAVKCDDAIDVIAGHRSILKNPANVGELGGAYLERHVGGEEYAVLLFIGRGGRLDGTIAIRKLATTMVGTTVLAEVIEIGGSQFDLEGIAASDPTPRVVELEYRINCHGRQLLIEANHRFPSWIGALGKCAPQLVNNFVDAGRGDGSVFATGPDPGTILYRLPQSGVLPLASGALTARRQDPVRLKLNTSRMDLASRLPGFRGSPHQFLVK